MIRRIREAFRVWWRNRVAVYYVYDPTMGTLQEQLCRIQPPPGARWRCRARMVVQQLDHDGDLDLPPHVDLLLGPGEMRGNLTMSADSIVAALGPEGAP